MKYNKIIKPIGMDKNKYGQLIFFKSNNDGSFKCANAGTIPQLASRIGISPKTYRKDLKDLIHQGFIADLRTSKRE